MFLKLIEARDSLFACPTLVVHLKLWPETLLSRSQLCECFAAESVACQRRKRIVETT
jgi:hypothetical protein